MITRFLAADVVVKDIDAAAKRYSEILGVKPNWKSYPDTPDLRECAFYPGNSKFVLLTSQGTDIYGQFLREKEEGVIAIYFEVDDIEQDVKRLKKLGVEFEEEEPTTFEEGKVIHASASSMYGILTGFAEARSDLPWGKKLIPGENFPNKR
jgi:catechol 2,3-dioxygenase-like lactoylglutathione lyase family enzyme